MERPENRKDVASEEIDPVLIYRGFAPCWPRLIPILCVLVVMVPLAVAYFIYSFELSMYLYQRTGGITSQANGWSHFGGAPYAWTIPLELPGTILLRMTQHAHGNHVQNGATFFGAILAFFMPPLLTAYCISRMLVDSIWRRRFCWGRWYWRAVVIVLGLSWIPVGEEWAFVYQYTVVY